MTTLDTAPRPARPAPPAGATSGHRPGEASARPVPVVWPPRSPRRLAGIPVGLLVCWQAALVPALVAIGRPAGHVVGLGIAAAAVVVITGYRPGGRWLHEWVVLWAGYLARGSGIAADGQPEPELALLDLAIRTEAISEVEIEGHQVATISHAHGCTAVLEIDPGAITADLPWLPLTVTPPHEPAGPAVSVQLLLHGTPAATAAPVRAWLAVQVQREPGYPTAELRRALVSAVRRLRRRLRSAVLAGVDAQTLDRARLRQALHTLTGLELTAPITPGVADPLGGEQWRAWWTRSVPHETLLVRSWPGLPGPPDPALFEALLRPRCPQTVSVAARRLRAPFRYGTARAGEEVLAIELLVRLAERDQPALDATVRQLSDQLAAVGVTIERLDGRQLPALAGTLPVGGFLPGYRPSAGAATRATRPHRTPRHHPPQAVPQAVPPAAAAAGPPGSPHRAAVRPAAAVASTTPAAPAWPNPPAPPAHAAIPAPPPAHAPTDPTTAALSAPTALEVPTAPLKLTGARAQVAIAQVHVPQPAPARPEPVDPAPPARPEPPATARGAAPVPVPASSDPPPASTPPPASPPPAAPTSPARGQARVAGPTTPAEPVRAHAAVPAPPSWSPPRPEPPVTPPPPPPHQSGPAPRTEPPAPPDPHGAVRTYGASLFTSESTRRPYVEHLVALVRTPQRSAQVVSVVAGAAGSGASVTAAGLARTLATLREDLVALLRAGVDQLEPATIRAVCHQHAFAILDVGAHVGEATAQALAASTRVVVVTGADRRATATTRLTLDRIHQVHPAVVADAVIAVVCRTGRQYRRVARGLSDDRSPQAARIVPVPPDPALPKMDQLDLARLKAPTREAFLRLAAAVTAAGAEPPAAGIPPDTANLHS